jgi:hypothetical protein
VVACVAEEVATALRRRRERRAQQLDRPRLRQRRQRGQRLLASLPVGVTLVREVEYVRKGILMNLSLGCYY